MRRRGDRVVGVSRTAPDWKLDGYEHFTADVADERAVKALFLEVRKRHGRLDALVNNAGIASMNHVLLTPLDDAALHLRDERVRHVPVLPRGRAPHDGEGRARRPHRELRHRGHAAQARGRGRVCRVQGGGGEPHRGAGARARARLAITVNAVGPTPIETDLIKSVPKAKMDALIARQAIPRMGTMDDVANVIDFFLRAESDFVTGQVVYLGGV